MNAKVKLTAGAMTLLLAGTVAVLAMQHNSIVQLRSENQAFAKDADESRELTKQNAEFPQLHTQAAEVVKLREDNRELPGLRSQVGKLRKEAADLTQLRAENQRLQAQLKTGAASGAAALPPDYVTRDALRDMGQATPENTMQTFFWAMSTGNIQRMAQCSVNGESALTRETDLEAQDLMKQMSAFPGFRVAEKTNLAPDEVQLGIEAKPGGVVAPIKLKLDGGQWKLDQ